MSISEIRPPSTILSREDVTNLALDAHGVKKMNMKILQCSR